MPALKKIGAAALSAFGFGTGASAVTANYLIVAGGGGAGEVVGGGGGAGGYQANTTTLTTTLSYTVVIGAGGAGGVYSGGYNYGTNGSNSTFGTLTASVGGGAGGLGDNSPGKNGGSGGGGGASSSGSPGAGGSGTSGQGNNGGSGFFSAGVAQDGGGGGGAGAVGANGSSSSGGNGGVGVASSISGTSTYYAGGGGGGMRGAVLSAGTGGTGGGANGNNGASAAASGTANTGGGGGASGYDNSGNFYSGGSGGSGIVIISYTGAQQFGGGVVTSAAGNTIHTFYTSGILSPLSSLSASYLIVAGGGGAGSALSGTSSGAGGGAGGLLSGSGTTIDTNSTYVVAVGAGGAGGASGGNNTGVQGSNSSFSIVSTTAVGGGYGGNSTLAGAGGNGGSGGGGYSAGGTATSGQGNNGGAGVTTGSGGGGGAGVVGGTGTVNTGGNGGNGTSLTISGTATYYAGGGGGAGNTTGGTAGLGGGGAGSGTGQGASGTTNTGGGGGGSAGYATYAGGSGGSGIVVIAYAGSTQQMSGGTVTVSGGNVIHTFTSSGYLSPLTNFSNSLRFRSSASAYLNRTFATPTSSTTWTWSAWVKRGIIAQTNFRMFSNNVTTDDAIRFDGNTSGSANTLRIYFNGGTSADLQTSQLFRDPAAWYHLVIAVDTTQATSSNRIKMYVNGSQVTAFSVSTYPSQNYSTNLNSAGAKQIGSSITYGEYFDGYMTNINFIDGQALTPNSFGSFNQYGNWVPVTYGGSYGTNGFFLPFTNTANATTLSYDFSPQGNNWTPNNISTTAGSTYDSMTDVPTLSNATSSNYATLNPLIPLSGTISDGNLKNVFPGTATNNSGSTMYGTSGQFYVEVTPSALSGNCGEVILGDAYNGIAVGYRSTGTKDVDSYTTDAAYGATWTVSDVIGMAANLTSKSVTFYKNGASQGAITYTGSAANAYLGVVVTTRNGVNMTFTVNYGQQPWAYTPPTGYVGWNSFNL